MFFAVVLSPLSLIFVDAGLSQTGTGAADVVSAGATKKLLVGVKSSTASMSNDVMLRIVPKLLFDEVLKSKL